MILKFINGEIVEELKNAKNSKTKMKVSFLHNIYVPLLLGEKKKKGATTFKKDYEYKYAACKYNGYITQDNFDNNEGLYFECHLQINKYKSFQGPLQIKPFTDFAFVTKTDKDEIPDVQPTTKICPYSFTEININATRCPHCTSEIEDK